jgi:hypothetical protein
MQEVKRYNLISSKGLNFKKIDLSEFANGIYFLKLNNFETNSVLKFVVQ